jgi:2-dehydro-3-deoxygalactonokinase
MNQFISCDWGTSSFRLRLIDTNTLIVLAESKSMEGIAATHNLWQQIKQTGRVAYYCEVLQKHIRVLESICGFPLAKTTIIVSGMASSQIGMIELPYQSIPINLMQADLATHIIPATATFPYEILLVSGVRTENDVMRGEETILAGCDINKLPSEQLFIFPGTHSKHVVVKEGMVTVFHTFMTGELFSLLATTSILANSVESITDDMRNVSVFLRGVKDAAHSNFLNAIFHVRTNHLFDVFNKSDNYEYLSGLLIGTELKNVGHNNYAAITIVSEGKLDAYYKLALSFLYPSHKIICINANEALVKGHAALYFEYNKQLN